MVQIGQVSSSRELLRLKARLHVGLLRMHPAKLMLIGYLSYILLGWALLSLPWSQSAFVEPIDNLFIATSAVSTTGLATIDIGQSYSFWGELVVLLLIQLGGLGYMTIGSFILVAMQDRIGRVREKATRTAFSLPSGLKVVSFIRAVVLFTLICEMVGAFLLYFMFARAGVENAVWSAIFHSISAFCTAGFSLNTNSLEGFRGDFGVNFVISVLCLAGAIGFLVVTDVVRNVLGKSRYLGFTSKVIFRMTLTFLVFGTLLFLVVDPQLQFLPIEERVMTAFFQVMSASTTVGFNTYPVDLIAPAFLVALLFLMMVGASPAGTGGGLKTTSFAALVGLLRSTLKGRDSVRFFKREIPTERLQTATASLALYFLLMTVSLFLLLITEEIATFEQLIFEIISAMGTVGLSLGATSELSGIGKFIFVLLMTAGRVGILTFGIALATRDETPQEVRDNDLVV